MNPRNRYRPQQPRKQVEEKQQEANEGTWRSLFHPLWFIVLGFVLFLSAGVIWMVATGWPFAD
jgi:hypothetical protein